MPAKVVKIKQCFPYIGYKNNALAFAISVLASYLYKLQQIDRKQKHPKCWHSYTYIYNG